MGDLREPGGQSRRAVGDGELLHGNYFNSIKVVRVKSLVPLRFCLGVAMPRQ
jgi:hypothetical protein